MSHSEALALQLTVAGIAVPGVIEAAIGITGRRSAGWFSVTLALSAAPGLAADLAALETAIVTLAIGRSEVGIAGWSRLITGVLDCVTVEPLRGIATLSGRDLAARFIDSPLAETFSNQSASEIAEILALRRGLAPHVTPTAAPAGRYYQMGHDALSLMRASGVVTEWDMLQSLAIAEGFDLRVAGETLIFGPAVPGTPQIWSATPAQSNLLSLRLEMRPAFAASLGVTVQSWHAKSAKMVKRSAGSTEGRHQMIRPNLPPDRAEALAAQTLADLQRQAYIAEAVMPGETESAPGDLVQVLGSNSAFDRLYVIDGITRQVTPQGGFVQTLRAVATSGVA